MSGKSPCYHYLFHFSLFSLKKKYLDNDYEKLQNSTILC